MGEVQKMRLWRWSFHSRVVVADRGGRFIRQERERWAKDLRRGMAVVVALSLWTGAGRMTASQGAMSADAEERFGEIHWYGGDGRYIWV